MMAWLMQVILYLSIIFYPSSNSKTVSPIQPLLDLLKSWSCAVNKPSLWEKNDHFICLVLFVCVCFISLNICIKVCMGGPHHNTLVNYLTHKFILIHRIELQSSCYLYLAGQKPGTLMKNLLCGYIDFVSIEWQKEKWERYLFLQ